ncbi:hypothetical protein C8R44DRAFT_744431 [Mycena epipterygia]|nr:hypothetical protein C8R44DRAFT_744431 [Mycena epipterygia]
MQVVQECHSRCQAGYDILQTDLGHSRLVGHFVKRETGLEWYIYVSRSGEAVRMRVFISYRTFHLPESRGFRLLAGKELLGIIVNQHGYSSGCSCSAPTSNPHMSASPTMEVGWSNLGNRPLFGARRINRTSAEPIHRKRYRQGPPKIITRALLVGRRELHHMRWNKTRPELRGHVPGPEPAEGGNYLVSLELLQPYGEMGHESNTGEIQLFLPTYYNNLDPGRIPNADALESPDEATISALRRAFLALHTLGRNNYMHYYFFLFIMRFRFDPETTEAVDSTPGIHVLAAKTWKSLVDGAFGGDIIGLSALCSYQSMRKPDNHPTMKGHHAKQMEEMIESTGGSLDDFTLLVVAHINLIQARPEQTSMYLESALDAVQLEILGLAVTDRLPVLGHPERKAFANAPAANNLAAARRRVTALTGGQAAIESHTHSPKHLRWGRTGAFLRAPLHQEYTKAKDDIFLRQIEFMVKHPDEPFYTYTLFNYTFGKPTVNMVSFSDVLETHPYDLDYGLMPYCALIVDAGKTLPLWIRRRSKDRFLSAGLRQLARGLPADADISRLGRAC